ncbi:MAG: pyridoxamine 5'-phosphate oxidase family protein [Candidatus Methanofastidiosia archaeon]
MRRKDKEIKDKNVIESIIKKATVCRIALSKNNIPYIVPVIFGYKDNCLYIHSATKGKKIDIIKKNNNICFELDVDKELIESQTPCKWSMKYYSVIGFGKAFFIDGFEEKRRALNIIMKHYSGNSHEFPENSIKDTAIIKVEIESMTGKKFGY